MTYKLPEPVGIVGMQKGLNILLSDGRLVMQPDYLSAMWFKPPQEQATIFTSAQVLAAYEKGLDRLRLPRSYGGSTVTTWADQKEGCTVRIHFTNAKEAEAWFNRLTDEVGRNLKESGQSHEEKT